jgi:hypothetical protein
MERWPPGRLTEKRNRIRRDRGRAGRDVRGSGAPATASWGYTPPPPPPPPPARLSPREALGTAGLQDGRALLVEQGFRRLGTMCTWSTTFGAHLGRKPAGRTRIKIHASHRRRRSMWGIRGRRVRGRGVVSSGKQSTWAGQLSFWGHAAGMAGHPRLALTRTGASRAAGRAHGANGWNYAFTSPATRSGERHLRLPRSNR